MNDKISVLYISHDSGITGAPLSLIDSLEPLREYIRPVVIMPKDGVLTERLNKLNINYYVVPFSLTSLLKECNSICENKRLLKSNLAAVEKIKQIIQDEKIDLIHSNSSVIDVGAFAAIKTNLPHVWHIREFVEEDMGHEYCCPKKLKKILFDRSSNIAISNAIVNSFNKKWNGNITRIYNGISLKRYNYNNFRKKGLNIIVVGTIADRKGQLDVVNAVRELIQEGLNPKLYIVGNKQSVYAELLQLYVNHSYLNNNVFFVGELVDISKYLKNASIAVMSSKNEALGRVTIEYMKAGIPVIGAKSGGTIELIGEKEERGYFYTSGDSQSLSKSIKRLLLDERVDNKIAAAKKFVDKEFDTSRYARVLYKYYQTTMENYRLDKERDEAIFKKILDYIDITNENETIIYKDNDLIHKYRELMKLSFQLLKAKTFGFSLKEYLERNGFYDIAIYGFSDVGMYIFSECIVNEIKVKFVIDKRNEVACVEKMFGIKHIKIDDELPKVDAIIITAYGAEDIAHMLSKKTTAKLIDIFTVIKEVI